MGSLSGIFLTDLCSYSGQKLKDVIQKYKKLHGSGNVFQVGNKLYRRN